ncbi:hypothetical protein M2G52_21040 [Vibrio vulnificus]|nr:hypothetical protein [Vibrio vulnificus]
MIKSLCGSFCIACLHPLTRRYAFNEKWEFEGEFQRKVC